MGVACPKCGNEDLKVNPISRFRLGIPHLSELQQAVVVMSCQPCRSEHSFRILGQQSTGLLAFHVC